MTDRKAVIKNADMSEDMQQDAVDCATQAMEKYNIEKDIAAYIKKVRQDGRGDGSKWSSASLHHWHMICKFRAFFILISIFGQCGEEALMFRAARIVFIRPTEVKSPQPPHPHPKTMFTKCLPKEISTLFYVH